VTSDESIHIPYEGKPLTSRQKVYWQVRVWDERGKASQWSEPQFFEMGLLEQTDWGSAEWIEHPTRAEEDPLPMFAKQFTVPRAKKLTDARFYVAGLGQLVGTINWRPGTDEVLTPGGTNEQLSVEYRGHDVTDMVANGANTLAVELGHGEAYSHRIPNPETGRTDPWARLGGRAVEPTVTTAPASAGASVVHHASTAGFQVGQTINVDTGDAGERLEQRRITQVDASASVIHFEPVLEFAHPEGAHVGRSGSVDEPDTRVTPRFIASLELTYKDGSREVIVSDRSWRTALPWMGSR
jgi:alpha-L-rhamnosidase